MMSVMEVKGVKSLVDISQVSHSRHASSGLKTGKRSINKEALMRFRFGILKRERERFFCKTKDVVYASFSSLVRHDHRLLRSRKSHAGLEFNDGRIHFFKLKCVCFLFSRLSPVSWAPLTIWSMWRNQISRCLTHCRWTLWSAPIRPVRASAIIITSHKCTCEYNIIIIDAS